MAYGLKASSCDPLTLQWLQYHAQQLPEAWAGGMPKHENGQLPEATIVQCGAWGLNHRFATCCQDFKKLTPIQFFNTGRSAKFWHNSGKMKLIFPFLKVMNRPNKQINKQVVWVRRPWKAQGTPTVQQCKMIKIIQFHNK